MSAPTKSFLDASQCIQGAFDDSTGSLRVEITGETGGGAIEVAINDSTDSIKIGNGSGVYAGVTSNHDLQTVAKIEDSFGNSLSSTANSLNVNLTNTAAVSVSNFPATQPISAASLPLPTGAATESTLSTLNAKVTTTVNGVKVDGSAVTQPISGSVSVSNFPATQAVTQSTSPWVVSGQSAVGTLPTNNPLSVSGVDGGGLKRSLLLDSTGKIEVDSISGTVSLPSGASTSANQTTANTSLASIDSKLTLDVSPATGSISAADVGSTITTGQSNQSIIAGTPTANSTASFSLSSMDAVRVMVSGAWVGTLSSEISLDGGTTWNTVGVHLSGTAITTGSFTANGAGHCNVSGCTNYRLRATAWTSGTATVKVVESRNPGSVYIANAIKLIDSASSNQASVSASNALKVDGSAVTQPVSGTVTANQGTSPWVVSQASNRTATGTLNAATPDGSINSAAAGSTVQITTDGSSTVALQTSGDWVGVLAFDVSYDRGTTWNKTQSIDASIASSSNLNKIFQGWANNLNADPWILNCAGSTTARIRIVSLSSGTATINLVASSGTYYVVPTQSNPNSNQVASNLASKKSYVSNTGPITGATSTGVKSLAYIWHPSTVTARYQITSINVNQIAGVGVAGGQRIELNRITAENGAPGGSTGTINPKDADDAASGATIRIAPTGAPTRLSGVLFGGDVPVQLNGNILAPGGNGTESIECKPFVMRVSQNEGYEIVQNVITTLTTAPTFNISFEWTEVS